MFDDGRWELYHNVEVIAHSQENIIQPTVGYTINHALRWMNQHICYWRLAFRESAMDLKPRKMVYCKRWKARSNYDSYVEEGDLVRSG